MAAAAAALFLHDSAAPGYDALYALAWGDALAAGGLPDYMAASAPTPHPLVNLLGAALAPFGDARVDVFNGLIFVAYGAAVCFAFRIGQLILGAAAGAAAALLVATRPGLVAGLLDSSMDVLFLALVLAAGAFAIERRDDRLVLATLVLAGLIRPEAWLLSVLFAAWRLKARRRDDDRAGTAVIVALACAGPLTWVLSDLLVSGDPFLSLTGTRELAAELGRPNSTAAGPRMFADYMFGLITEPIAWAGALGLLGAILWLGQRAVVPSAIVFAGIGSFLSLGIVGLPVLGRYLLLPGIVLTIFAGMALLMWRDSDAPARQNASRILLGVVCTLAVAASIAPAQRAIDRSVAIHRIDAVKSGDLKSLLTTIGVRAELRQCDTLSSPDYRALPLLSLLTDTPPGRVEIEADERRAVARLLHNRPDPAGAQSHSEPSGDFVIAENRSWRIEGQCRP